MFLTSAGSGKKVVPVWTFTTLPSPLPQMIFLVITIRNVLH